MYEPHRIQQEGRLLQIGEETGSGKTQSCEGAGGKTAKNTSWKHRSTCENCGTEFPGRNGAANRFCKNMCQHEFSVKRWLECSKCMAAIGIGSQTAGRLLGVSPTNVRRGWKNYGIETKTSITYSIVKEGRSLVAKKKKKEMEPIIKEEVKWKQYERAWMGEIKSHRAFPNWSSLHKPKMSEKNRAKANAYYHALSDEDKKTRNNRCRELRIAKWIADPSVKKKDYLRMNMWKKKNPEKAREMTRRHIAKKKIINPGFKVQCNLRNRLKDLMVSVKRGGTNSIRSLIGCSTIQLAKHLESGFTKRMTWKNYGTYWHVDHILPCASFDHTDDRQVAQCWHWTNLRALDAKKNADKSNKITEPQMQLLLCVSH